MGPVAVVGVGLRLPGGVVDPGSLRTLLREGRDAIGPVPADRWDPVTWGTPPAGGFLPDLATFDAGAFGLTDREADELDPAQRLLLQVAWEGLEHAGLAPDRQSGSRTGIYVGSSLSDYGRRHFLGPDAARIGAYAGTGSLLSVAAGRIAYTLGTSGPAMVVDTACSSSLVAVALAVRALRSGEIDRALAGGANVVLAPQPSVWFRRIGALSADGRCRPFDAAADGYGRSEGAGLVVLERLEDAVAGGRRILAVIEGVATNHDGRTHGLTAPSGQRQQDVIRAALADAGRAPHEVDAIETHGTGTPLGDPIEVDALRAVFLEGRDRPLWLSAVKANVGHLESAAGVAGLASALAMLEDGRVGAHPHLSAPNPRLRLDGLRIPTAPEDVGATRVGVSAFGLSGTNAHLVLAAPPSPPPPAEPLPYEILVLSGRSADHVRAQARAWGSLDGPTAGLADAARQRATLQHRAAVLHPFGPGLAAVAEGRGIGRAARRPNTALLFSGQGSHRAGMGLRASEAEPRFREALDEALEAVDAALGRPLRPLLADEEALGRTEIAQPALFAIGWAAATFWERVGLEPDVVAGHSVGELTAAAWAGVWSLRDAARLVVARGRLVAACPPGAMLAVAAPEREVLARVGGEVEVAAVNAPDETVLTGTLEAIEAAEHALEGVRCRRLRVDHAFHSRLLDGALDAFEAEVRAVPARPPRVPLISAIDGAPLGERALDPSTWREHLRRPVRFADAAARLVADGVTLAIEVGARPVLGPLLERAGGPGALPSLAAPDEAATLARSVADAWVAGAEVDTARGRAAGGLAALPPTVFLGRRHWLSAPEERPRVALRTPVRQLAPAVPPGPEPRLHHPGDGDPEQLVLDAIDAVRGALRDEVPLRFVLRAGRVAHAAVDGLAAVARREHPGLGAGVTWWDGVDPDALAVAVRRPEPTVFVVGDRVEVETLGPCDPPFSPLALPTGTVVLTGGTGAVGGRLRRWLEERGATRVLAPSRAELDLRYADAVGAWLDRVSDLVGVVHAAGTLADAPLLEHDAARVAEVMGARVRGALSLDRATRGRGLALFALVSSASGRAGTPGQAAYAAAARILEAVAQDRRAHGEVGSCLSFGPWTVGMGDADPRRVASWARLGIGRLDPDVAVAGMERALGGPAVVTIEAFPEPVPLPEPTPPADPRALVERAVAGVLGWRDGRVPDPRTGFVELGLDSITALELRDRLQEATGLPLSATVAFDHPDVERLAAHLAGLSVEDRPSTPPARAASDGPIAVIGRACRLPGGIEDPDAFWTALLEGRDTTSPVPADRFDVDALFDPVPGTPGRTATRVGGFVDELFVFDPERYGIAPAEAAAIDPQHRMLLEGAWRALEDAGLPPPSLRDQRVGVYVGVQAGEYGHRFDPADPDTPLAAATGFAPCFAAGRLAHAFGFRGPAIAVDTACSSSLVALAAAVRDLRQGVCDTAVVAGVHAITGPDTWLWMSAIGALSASGRCRPFDADADGYVRGEGCVTLVLRRAAEVAPDQRVHGRILGVATNHDGRSAGLTVPHGPAQRQVVSDALADADVRPADVGYVSCHGTGTPLGDPIEALALAEALGDRDTPLWLGASKAVVGHLEAGAGLVGLLQALLVLEHAVVPPIAGLRTPNPALPARGLALPTHPVPWTADRRVAGASAFGLSGTNAHVVLDRPPTPDRVPADRRPRLVVASGRTDDDLRAAAGAFARATSDPADLEHTSLRCRAPLARRAHVVATDAASLRDALEGPLDPVEARDEPGVVFLCTGAGPQRVGMARGLLETEPAFREGWEEACAAADRRLPRPLAEVVAHEEVLHDLAWTQPAMFAVCWASARWWASLGVRPAAVIGHSTGQLVAACLAGVMDLETAMALTVERARLTSELPRDGEMVAVLASEAEVAPLLSAEVSLAAINGPREVVLSGRRVPVLAAAKALQDAGHELRPLVISHAAHSACVDPILPAVHQLVAGLELRPPRRPMIDAVTGTWADAAIATPEAWTRHLREPVRFADGVRTLLGAGHRVFLELGNHPVLAGMVGRIAPEATLAATMRRDVSDEAQVLDAVGRLWSAGVALDTAAFLQGRGGRMVDLPRSRWGSVHVHTRRATARASLPVWTSEWTPVRPEVGGLGGRPMGTTLVVGRGELARALVERRRGARRVQPTELEAALREGAELLVVTEGFSVALAAVRAAVRQGHPRVVLVSDGADPGLAGLVVTAEVEAPELEILLVDLDPGVDPLVHLELVLDGGPRNGELAVRDGRHMLRTLAPAQASPAPRWRPPTDRTVLVTGGAGALGRSLVARLGDHAPVVLVGRTPPSPVDPRFVAADLTEPDAVPRLLAELEARGLPPIGAVFHLAGVVEDGALATVDPASITRVWGPKVDAALALDAALPHARPFVVVGSAAATVGSAGQAVYAGANAALEGLIRARRARGEHGLCLHLGPLAGTGLAARGTRDQEAQGVRPLPHAVALDALDEALASDRTAPTVLDVDWDRWAARQARVPTAIRGLVHALPQAASVDVADAVRDALRAVLGDRADGLPEDRGFADAGLDSLMAVDLARRLRSRLGLPLPATLAFDHPTTARLVGHLRGLGQAPTRPSEIRTAGEVPVAIVGMGLRLPGSVATPEGLWELLTSGVDPVGPVPGWRWDHDALYDPEPGVVGRTSTREAAFLDREVVEGFDAASFGISEREAASMDPQHRLLLLCAREALERARIPLASVRGTRGAVIVGIGDSGYLERFRAPGAPRYPDAWAGTGQLGAFASGRLAHVLGLRGPNLALNTACSSSLVALHLACRALRDGEADLALAGGAHLMLAPDDFLYVSSLRALSPGGRCRTFDASADGYGRGEGVGVFALVRLDDALRRELPVLAVIRGTAVGHDGAASGLTVPSRDAQADVIRAALARSELSPDQVSHVEAHGTGTALGDPIEVGALADVFGERGPEAPLWLSAVKATLGHLEVAAGVASVAKVVLALGRRELPPHRHLERPNPELRLDERGFRVPTEAVAWTAPDGVLRSGVSGFGLAGTDAHLVLEEPPATRPPPPAPDDRGAHWLAVSGSTPTTLRRTAADLVPLLRTTRPGDLQASLLLGRSPAAHRRAVVGRTPEELAERLLALATGGDGGETRRATKVGFLFAGQGGQWPGMGLALARWPAFAEVLERAEEVLAELGRGSLREAMASDEVHHTLWTQPALFVLEVGLARLYASFGIEPALVLGHSVGGLAAATVAGVWSLDDGLRLVATRARLLASLPRDGAMAAVQATEEVVRERLRAHPGVELAAVNHPEACAVAGPADAVDRLLAGWEVPTRRLATSHAFHCALVEPVLDAWEEAVRAVPTRPARIGVVSDLHGGLATDAELRDPVAWRQRMRDPVRFLDGLRTLAAQGVDLLVELGPHGEHTAMARAATALPCVPSQLRDREPHEALLDAVGTCWEHGLSPDALALDAGVPRPPVALPTTPVELRRTWLELPEWPQARPSAEGWLVEERWVPSTPAVLSTPDEVHRIELGPEDDPTPLWTAVLERIRRRGGRLVVVTRGATDGTCPPAAAFHGLVRAARAEDPTLRPSVVDVVGEADPDTVDAAIRADDEPEARVVGNVREVRRLVPARFATRRPPDGAVVLISGGLTGIGQAAARALAGRSAGLVLIGRRPPEDGVHAWLSSAPCPVRVVQGDVADPEVARRAVDAAHELALAAPLAVLHLAGVLADRSLENTGPEDLATTLRPKLGGARALADAVEGRRVVGFLLASAGAGWLGAPGQAAYASANTALDAFARSLRVRGLPAVAVAWGAWEDVGMAARLDPALEARRAERGLGTIPLDVGLRTLDALWAHPSPLVAVLPTDWPRYAARHPSPLLAELAPPAPPSPAAVTSWVEAAASLPPDERRARVTEEVEALVRRVLRVPADRDLDPDTSLHDLGLDSLLAIDLKNALAEAGVDLPIARVVVGPSPSVLAAEVDAALPAVGGAVPQAVGPPVHPVVSHAAFFVLGALFVLAAWVLAMAG
ncbi:MAG: SDR family NAD(P)-dependent oxidoreductase [Alphaproteobacteria bacterium]|nr:SDR family NAD(P)-dependent oxidoreductase [Alphaproteobacteria bacterium]MCB9697962.1 SDR family NAD(P)-dependent oxidoreductase [Alphaproteobacteria bacterium]